MRPSILLKHSPSRHPLVLVAAAIIVVAGLKASGELVVPFLFALVLSILAMPLVGRLEKWKLPTVWAVLIAVLSFGFLATLLGGLLGGSIATFSTKLPEYQIELAQLGGNFQSWLGNLGVDTGQLNMAELINPAAAIDLLKTLLDGLLGLFSNSILIALTMTFLLLEASGFGQKLRAAFGADTELNTSLALGAQQVQKYLALKAVVSLGTGFCIWAWTAALGLDLPLLWGLVAFILNFVPSIGSIIAAVPATLLAWLQLGGLGALGVGSGFLIVNMVLGNMVEPRLMGRRLGLSPLVVFLSLLFWGWVWGPAGMLLSVPLTVIAKIMLETTAGGRPWAVLLGPSDETPSN